MRNPDIWTSGRVTRWHQNEVMNVHYQTDADHQWGVAALYLVLHPDPSMALLRECMFHDCGEHASGDVSSPAKQENPALAAESFKVELAHRDRLGVPPEGLTDEDLIWRDMLDRLESVRFVRLREPQLLEDDDWKTVIRGIMRAAQTLGVTDEVLKALNG